MNNKQAMVLFSLFVFCFSFLSFVECVLCKRKKNDIHLPFRRFELLLFMLFIPAQPPLLVFRPLGMLTLALRVQAAGIAVADESIR